MKKTTIITLPSICLATLVACLTSLHAEKDWKNDEAAEQAALTQKAKITEAAARATASTKVPGGTVKSVEIEEEKGHLIWSYDFTQPDSKNITEVQVDALTGKIASVEIETPKDIAKEEAEDHEAKKDQEEKDDK